MRLLILGDTHGNAEFLFQYVYPVAATLGADAIVQLGDFGAWEHLPSGARFMDEVSWLSGKTDIPLYWLHGNHDKHSHTIAVYPRDERGFYRCRSRLYYIPQGHAWTWQGVRMRAFGGAYSVDKKWRVDADRQLGRTDYLWFPEEQMSEQEMDELLAADSGRKDIVFSHDKPRSANPAWNRKDLPECLPNQLRLERALRVHQPQFWFHGHLHYYYTDTLAQEAGTTTVVGLEPDWDAAEPGYRRAHSWLLAELSDATVTVTAGRDIQLDAELMQRHLSALN